MRQKSVSPVTNKAFHHIIPLVWGPLSSLQHFPPEGLQAGCCQKPPEPPTYHQHHLVTNRCNKQILFQWLYDSSDNHRSPQVWSFQMSWLIPLKSWKYKFILYSKPLQRQAQNKIMLHVITASRDHSNSWEGLHSFYLRKSELSWFQHQVHTLCWVDYSIYLFFFVFRL